MKISKTEVDASPRKTKSWEISQSTVKALVARAKPFIRFDEVLHGFGVRVAPSGMKSFVLEYRPYGGGRGANKRRKTLGAYGALTAAQAREMAMDDLAGLRNGVDPMAAKQAARTAATVSDLIDAFLKQHAEAKCKPGTVKNYEIGLAHLRAAHGGLNAEVLTRSQVAKLHLDMADSPYAANRFLAVVSKLFSWGVDRGLLPEGHVNPAGRIQKYREEGRERFLTSEELARLGDTLRQAETIGLPYEVDEAKVKAKHAPKPENRVRKIDPYAIAAVRLLLLTGARLNEIVTARWGFVDFERGLLNLPASKTGKKSVVLSAAALAVLASLPRIEGNPHIIPGDKEGQPRADLKKPWAAITQAARLEGLRIHDLRHSFASVGADSALSLPIIGKLLGHTQASTTQRYSHLGNDPVRRAAETIGATIAAAMGDRGKGEVVPMKRKV